MLKDYSHEYKNKFEANTYHDYVRGGYTCDYSKYRDACLGIDW